MTTDQEATSEFESMEEYANKEHSIPYGTAYALFKQQQNDQMLASLPGSVKRRIKALKKMQLERTVIEAKFFKELHKLERKYYTLYSPLFEKRDKIVNGIYEPTDEECQWESDEEDNLPEGLRTIKEVKGIPDFWLTIFSNVGMLSEMVEVYDVPILAYLSNVKAFPKEQPMSFTLEFHFSKNNYFKNRILTKEYETRGNFEEVDPFNLESPEMKCIGCIIDWYEDKDVTMKKNVRRNSFFNFFNPPSIPDDQKEDIDDNIRRAITVDFEIGNYIRGRIVQRAVLFFTGEGCEDEDDFIRDFNKYSDEESDDVEE